MRHVLALVVFVGLTGCAGEYSKVPEPTGEWVPANPASLMVEAKPPRPQIRRAVWRRRPRVAPAAVVPAAPAATPAAPPTPAATPASPPTSDKVAAQ